MLMEPPRLAHGLRTLHPNRAAGRATALLVLLLASRAEARPDEGWEEPTHRLGVSAGFGYSFPNDDDATEIDEADGTGGFAEVEYIYHAVEWATPRAYAGVLVTSTDRACELTPCDVSAQIGFIGIKGRLLAPIPYVAPFIELGFGGSVGSVTTRVANIVDAAGDGVMYHVPIAVGLVLGGRRQFELALQYMIHPEQVQVNGALAFGFSFALH
jgi:hypothetical protein